VRAWLERALVARWYAGPAPVWLRPLAGLYAGLAALNTLPWALGLRQPWRAPCPVLVVGNLVVGGAGKTPTVIALVQALRALGWRPGVVSRGHGRRSRGTQVATAGLDAAALGDEPWLIHRRTRAPVAVGTSRVEAAKALLQAHPEVNLLIADDGLQHHALARDLELWVFDERGVGNGALLPAGPLRQALPGQLPARARVLYNAPAASTALPGALATRRLAGAVLLADWRSGQPMAPAALQALRGRPVLAIAGIAAPERFFGMLRGEGLTIIAMPLPDHADLATLPWPPGTAEVLCTEKDAAKLDPARCGHTQVWVVGLDFRLPPELIADLHCSLAQAATAP
jgi:tetraacyldisaccharide 4'-kinase